jgi:hypothetical protein
MQQNSALLAAMVKGNGGMVAAAVVAAVAAAVAAAATVEAMAAAVTNAVIMAQRQFSQTATNWLSTWRPIVIRSQQTRNKFLPGTSPPNQTDSLNSFNIDDWIMCNKPTSLPPTITLCNYWTPLASQVKALDPPPRPLESLLLTCQ